MSFHLSAEDIEIRDNHILFARLLDESGDYHDSSIDLNDFLGNDNGRFQWEGRGFADTADSVTFHIEGGGEVPVLRAQLQNVDQEWVGADVNLAERIININGSFEFQ